MNPPSPILLQEDLPCLSAINLNLSLTDKDTYKLKLKKWQRRMHAVQQAYYRQGHRAIIVYEGWDAAGKGGAIRRLTEKLDPRGYRVYPIGAPRKDEQGRHYLYRFQVRLPRPGALAIFDRSYYGRVLVERVEGFATDAQWQRAYQEINEFERTLMDDGVRIIKLFMHISPDEQLNRFEERLRNPIKRWKLTEEDIRNRVRWGDYEHAIDDMFQHTSTEAAPWHIVGGNYKWYARIQSLKTVVKALESGVDTQPPPLDQELIAAAEQQLGLVLKV